VLGIETPDHGVVLATPMDMAQVASIALRDWGKVGNFAFGGSDFVVIFEARADFVLTVPHMPEAPPGAGVTYKPSLQGQQYGCFGGDDQCGTEPAVPPPSPGCTSSQLAR
jgi:phosphatidylserine decarboxylase